MKPRRIRREGAYIIRAAESRPLRFDELRQFAAGRPTPLRPVVTEADRALVRAILAAKAGRS